MRTTGVALLAASCACGAALVTVTLASGKGPGNYSCTGPGQIRRSAFHFTDPGGCAINDPNAPFYDSRTGIYHLFYQLHVWEDVNRSDCASGGPGPVWGHAYSRDMVTWVPLPPALWNDQWYDRCAVYTGSATILAGGLVIMYPGICQQDDHTHNCTTGTNLNLAAPSDPRDPLLTNWSKAPSNPVVNNTGRDPSGAWQTTDGKEWRTVTFDGQVFSSSDGFKSWQRAAGPKPGFPGGECPSLFPLPGPAKPFDAGGTRGTSSIHRSGSTDGGGGGGHSGGGGGGGGGSPSSPSSSNAIRGGGSNVTHVFKHGGSWHDAYVVGRYDDGPPGSAGTWTTCPMPDGGNPRTQMGTAVNVGAAYAAKDFLDTRLKGRERRILWTWGFGLPGMLIPREVTWDAALMQLVFSPLDEFTQLRTGPLLLPHGLNGSTLASNESRMISESWLPKGAGNCSELIVRFEAPPAGCAARFGVGLLLGSGRNTSAFVDWQEPPPAAGHRAIPGNTPWTARVGVGTPDPQHYNRTVMQGVELSADWSASCLDPAGSGRWSVHENWTCLNDTCNPHGCCTPTKKTMADCEAACEGSGTCVAWTYAS